MEIAGKGYNNKEIAEIFEEKLKENDPDASVTYQSSNNTFEVDYKDHMFEVQPSGELTSNREEVIKDIEEAWENTDKEASGEDKAEQVQEELNKKDPDSTAEYNPETGNTDVNHGGYEAEVDEDGNVTIKGPEEDSNINIDTDGDGNPDINVDTDEDGIPDINVDEDGDLVPDVDIDENEDKIPDKNVTKLAITTQPQAVETISNTSDVSFEVEVTGAKDAGSIKEEKITYQWYYNTKNSNENGTPIQNANGSTYTIDKDNVIPSISGSYYYCVVTQEYRGKTNIETTNTALLTVISPVEITSSTEDVQVVAGANNAIFTVGVSGNGEISYQWYYKIGEEGEEKLIDGANESSYAIEKEEVTTDLNGNYYYVEITQKYGSSTVTIKTEPALLTVIETSIVADPTSVVAYVGGGNKTVTLSGENAETFIVTKAPTQSVATADIQNNILTITPVGVGRTSVIVQETKGGKTVEITIEVKETTIEVSTNNVTAYIDGEKQTVTINGDNLGELSISGLDEEVAKVSVKDNTLTIEAVGEGSTTIVVTEANGGKTVQITIEVKTVTMAATSTSVTAYVGGADQEVTIIGTNLGELSVATPPTANIATASLEENNVLKIHPVGKGNTTVTVTEANSGKTVTINIEVIESTITATSTNVTLYAGGSNQTVEIQGTDIGTLNISEQPEETVATVKLEGNTLTITPVGAGSTEVTVIEANGNQTVTVKITVLATSITPQSIEVYAGGTAKTLEIEGLNMGTLTIENGPDTAKATVTLDKTSLIVTPVAAGTTSLTLKESNGNKTATISIMVLETSIIADPQNVTAKIGETKTVTLSGTNAGEFSIVTSPEGTVATAQISGNILTIVPVAKGETSVVVKENNGNKETTINITISAEVSASDIPGTDYGAIVNGYETESGGVNNWLLFYSDDENIYLIADDYIPYENIPSNSAGHKPGSSSNYLRSGYFTNELLNDYSGTASITDPDIKALNNDFFTMGYSSESDTMKAIAYMLDTDAWSGFAGEKAEYAVGEPTIEMVMNSYSKKYGVYYKTKSNIFGYQISNNGGSSWLDTINEMLNKGDRTYVINTTENAPGYWIASPAATGNYLCVSNNGDVLYGNNIHGGYGFRPMVCLKSDTKLEKNPDGSYTIVEPPKNNNIDPTTDYGAIVNGYESEYSDVVGWRIFYADTENTYLIADDYIPYENIPSNSAGHKPTQSGNYPRAAYFVTDVLNDYSGLSSITDPRLQALNSAYFTNQSSSTFIYGNMNAVAYMLDTDVWSVYAGDKAEYAIGGPSLELFVKSYNEHYGTSYTTSTNNYGYYINNSESMSLSKSEKPYVITSESNAYGMWVASPSASYNNNIMYVHRVGNVAGVGYSATYCGFRPLVCLKSDTELKKNDDGSFTIVNPPKTAADIPATDYGAIVNGYECENSAAVNNWQIFYSDDENIYLIANDYIPYEYVPSNNAGNRPVQGAYPECNVSLTNLNNLGNDYSGTASITDSNIKALNNDYFTKNYSSSNINMKAVAYMLDTNAWKVYAGSKAEYAIGGPTLELLFKSYNEKYNMNYSVQAKNTTGYEISNNNGTSWANYYDNMLNTSDLTYVINNFDKADGMWIASPSAFGIDRVMQVDGYGDVCYNGYLSPDAGFRPLVCLNSNIKLVKNSDGSYTII